MPTLYVENVPLDLYEALRTRAHERRKSISAEVIALLEENVPTAKELASRGKLVDQARRIRARRPGTRGPLPGCGGDAARGSPAVTACVIDASVAAKWFLPPSGEPLAAEALRLLQSYAEGRLRLSAPDLFWPEFGNILWKAVRQGRISRESAEEAIQALEHRGIPTAPSLPLLRDAFSIAAASGRTVYDALYVALAMVSNAPLVTADERLANALAARYPVRWLGAV